MCLELTGVLSWIDPGPFVNWPGSFRELTRVLSRENRGLNFCWLYLSNLFMGLLHHIPPLFLTLLITTKQTAPTEPPTMPPPSPLFFCHTNYFLRYLIAVSEILLTFAAQSVRKAYLIGNKTKRYARLVSWNLRNFKAKQENMMASMRKRGLPAISL